MNICEKIRLEIQNYDCLKHPGKGLKSACKARPFQRAELALCALDLEACLRSTNASLGGYEDTSTYLGLLGVIASRPCFELARTKPATLIAYVSRSSRRTSWRLLLRGTLWTKKPKSCRKPPRARGPFLHVESFRTINIDLCKRWATRRCLE